MKKPKPAASAATDLSTWRGAIVTERQGNLKTVHRAAHVFVTPTWVCWIETAYADPLAEIRPSFHLRDGGAVWADGRFRTSTAADGREIDVVPFKPEEHQTSSNTFQSFNDWLASEGRTWQEERERMRARVNKAISRVKAKHPYAIDCWDSFWGVLTTQSGAIERSDLRGEIADEISAIENELDSILLPMARKVEAIAPGSNSRVLMGEMLSPTFSKSDFLGNGYQAALVRIVTLSVSAARQLLDEGCIDDARATVSHLKRTMVRTSGYLAAVRDKRAATGKRGTDGILKQSEKVDDLLRLNAQPLSTEMSKSAAATVLKEMIGGQIGMGEEQIRRRLCRLFKGDKWPYRGRPRKKS